jgi:K(+)-stimulated pyrophosphate-energized sodium pump
LRIDDKYLEVNPQAAGGYRFTANKPAGAAKPSLSPNQPPLARVRGVDLRPIASCVLGLLLAVLLNGLSGYYTGNSRGPIKSLNLACHTGAATNIIQGLALGYEAAVMSTVIIATGIALSILCYQGCPPVFVAYGMALSGVGMLTLSGNTIAMNVFGPVADNAKCIGEIAYDRAEMGEDNYLSARQILDDLDMVGNTTKAETRGLAAASAMIAAASMFASYIVILSMGSEDQIVYLSLAQFNAFAQHLTLAQPVVLIGLLLGGAVPWLFSSMLIRAVGRAAFYVIKECRLQLNDDAIWQGKRRPDYGRVVAICTSAAQAELLGPAILAIASPLAVGLVFGPYALGGFLAGAILSGFTLGVFMSSAGAAWDNVKNSIESEPRDPAHNLGKGSSRHKAAVTGDAIGDPLKDTAGPAINPLLKVMTMVSMLALAPMILPYNMTGQPPLPGASALNSWTGAFLAVALFAMIVWAIAKSKIETLAMREAAEI